MLKSICKYISENDRNSDIMDMYEEFLDENVDFETIVITCQTILGDWKEDIELNGMTKRERGYYDWLGI